MQPLSSPVMATGQPPAPTAATPNNILLVIVASSVGTLIEWYDLFLAIILASTLAANLFPPGDNQFLETLGVVASSYIIRPFGSLLFGSIGDRVGRKNSFLASLLIMGGATFLIGCIPSFSQAGWLAPIMLLVLRLFQGLAISGEYAGATIYVAEHAPANRRGFYTGFIQATVPFGLIICLAVVYLTRSAMSPESFTGFGWRLPFLLSSVLVFMSYLIRRKLHESPMFSQLKREGKSSKSPIKESFSTPGNVALMLKAIFGGTAAQSSLMQVSLFVSLFFMQRAAKIPDTTALLIVGVAALLGGPTFQIFGGLSDRVGRKPLMLAGLLVSAVMIPLSFYLFMHLGNPEGLKEVHPISAGTTGLFILLTTGMIVGCGLIYGPLGAFMLELFPTKIRYTSMGFAYNVSMGVIGGLTPFITELIKAKFDVGPGLTPFIGLTYPMMLITLALVVNLLAVPETYRNSLSDESHA